MAFDAFLKLDGISGESKDSKHKGEIEILSFSWGVSNSGRACSVGGGGGEGKATFQDFSFVHRFDTASPQLMAHCANGKHISEGTITVRKAGGEQTEFLKIRLDQILVSSSQAAGGGGSEPMEQVSLNFTKIEVTNTTTGEASSFDVCAVREQ